MKKIFSSRTFALLLGIFLSSITSWGLDEIKLNPLWTNQILFLIAPMLVAYLFTRLNPEFPLANLKYTFIGFLICVLTIATYSVLDNQRHKLTDDMLQRNDIKTIGIALELYKKDHGAYPPIPQGCHRTTILREELVPRYLLETSLSGHGYKDPVLLGFNQEMSNFVLAARFDNRSHPALKKDFEVDGSVYGCSCNDPYYCVTSR